MNLLCLTFRVLGIFSEYMNGFILSMFLGGVLWLCTALYQMLSVSTIRTKLTNVPDCRIFMLILIKCVSFHQKFDIHFMQSFIAAQSVTLIMFIYCYCGNSLTTSCERTAYAALQLSWYKYPMKYQKFLKQIVLLAQQPFYLSGYHMMKCSFETFKSVSWL